MKNLTEFINEYVINQKFKHTDNIIIKYLIDLQTSFNKRMDEVNAKKHSFETPFKHIDYKKENFEKTKYDTYILPLDSDDYWHWFYDAKNELKNFKDEFERQNYYVNDGMEEIRIQSNDTDDKTDWWIVLSAAKWGTSKYDKMTVSPEIYEILIKL